MPLPFDCVNFAKTTSRSSRSASTRPPARPPPRSRRRRNAVFSRNDALLWCARLLCVSRRWSRFSFANVARQICNDTYSNALVKQRRKKKGVVIKPLLFFSSFSLFFCLVLVRPTFAWPTLIFQSIFYHRQRISFFPNKQRLSFTLFLVSDPLCIYTTPGRDILPVVQTLL